MTRNKREEALDNLCWIRKLNRNDQYMLEEVTAINAAIETQQSSVGLGFWQPFKALWRDRKVAYRFFLGCSLFFWQNSRYARLLTPSPVPYLPIYIFGNISTQVFSKWQMLTSRTDSGINAINYVCVLPSPPTALC